MHTRIIRKYTYKRTRIYCTSLSAWLKCPHCISYTRVSIRLILCTVNELLFTSVTSCSYDRFAIIRISWNTQTAGQGRLIFRRPPWGRVRPWYVSFYPANRFRLTRRLVRSRPPRSSRHRSTREGDPPRYTCTEGNQSDFLITPRTRTNASRTKWWLLVTACYGQPFSRIQVERAWNGRETWKTQRNYTIRVDDWAILCRSYSYHVAAQVGGTRASRYQTAINLH